MKLIVFFLVLMSASFGFSQSEGLPDEDARFPGGSKEMIRFIKENKKYPEVSRKTKKQRKVFVTFIVQENGELTNIDVMRGGLSVELNADAIGVISVMPNWTPARIEGVAVKSRCRLPITYNLGGREIRRIRRKQRREG
jgi:TonB family protein